MVGRGAIPIARVVNPWASDGVKEMPSIPQNIIGEWELKVLRKDQVEFASGDSSDDTLQDERANRMFATIDQHLANAEKWVHEYIPWEYSGPVELKFLGWFRMGSHPPQFFRDGDSGLIIAALVEIGRKYHYGAILTGHWISVVYRFPKDRDVMEWQAF